MKKTLVIFVVLLSIIVNGSCSSNTSGKSFLKETNEFFSITIPNGQVQYYYNSFNSGQGFHGDGEIVEIIHINAKDNENFKQSLGNNWMRINSKNDIYNYLWGSESVQGKESFGGVLSKKLIAEPDLVFILYDITNDKTNSSINFSDIYDFYYIGYSYKKRIIYIQKTNL